MKTINSIKKHYLFNWGEFTEHDFHIGPIHDLLPEFRVLKFKPDVKRNYWIYATCGMSINGTKPCLELFIFAPTENDFLIELLVAVAYYHVSGHVLGLGHTVNFGCPWYDGSKCDYGLISLPYLDGPSLEWLKTDLKDIQFLWLIPITKEEVEYKKNNGLEALECLFEENSLDYINPFRESTV